MTTPKSRFKNEAAGFGLFLLGAIIAASLVAGGSLSPFGGGAVGWVGKLISKTLSFGLGVCSYLVPAACGYFSIRILFSDMDRRQASKDAAAIVFLVISCCLFSAVALEKVFTGYLTLNGAGGKLGTLAAGLTLGSLGMFGSYIISLSITAVCVVFLLRTSLLSVLSGFFGILAKLLRTAAAVCLKTGGFLIRSAVRTGRKVSSIVAEQLKKRREKTKKAILSPVSKTQRAPDSPEKKTSDEQPKIVVKKEKTPLVIVDKDTDEQKPARGGFQLPPIELLEKAEMQKTDIDKESAYKNARLIEEKLESFGVSGKVTEIKPGPVITMFEYKPAPGVKVSKISALENDLAMSLSALKVRTISPIPGRDVVGIEVPNAVSETVCLRELIENWEFSESSSFLTIAVGKDISGTPYYTNLAAAPHLMIAGTTGSGKSVLMNSLLASLFYKAGPDRVRLLMIDPKMLEFAIYEGIPHLLHPIVTEPRKAIAALKWAVAEMESRYRLLSQKGVRNIDSYNTKIENEKGADSPEILPYIVILIDELADLILSAAADTREAIIRIAQKARAAGIHLVVATQRPSADVVSGLLKANIPARISFLVSSKVDSRVVLDAHGAESLLGKGDMLFLKPGTNSLERIQGALITDGEREKIVDFLKSQSAPVFDEKVTEAINKSEQPQNGEEKEGDDDMYEQALNIVRDAGQVSISMLQRRLKIGYNRAATIVEQMEKEGIVGEHKGAGKAREVNFPTEE